MKFSNTYSIHTDRHDSKFFHKSYQRKLILFSIHIFVKQDILEIFLIDMQFYCIPSGNNGLIQCHINQYINLNHRK